MRLRRKTPVEFRHVLRAQKTIGFFYREDPPQAQLLRQPVQGHDFLAQVTETNHDYRVIPIDRRPQTADPDPSLGAKAGAIEGETRWWSIP